MYLQQDAMQPIKERENERDFKIEGEKERDFKLNAAIYFMYLPLDVKQPERERYFKQDEK